MTSGKKKIEIAVTPRKNGGVQNGAPATPTTPSTPATPSQPQSGRAKRSKAMRRQKSDFYRGGRSTELSPPLKHCQKILTKLMSHNCAWPFNKPVDPISLNIPDYFDIIKFPMDLGTIQEQLGNGFYDNVEDFANDVRLVWRNAYTYNKAGSDVCIMATELSTVFEGEFKKVDPEEQVPEPAPVTPAPASRKRTPNSRAKASPVGGVVTPAKTPVSKAKPAPKPKTPKKEEAVVKPKGSTKRVEEEKKSSSAQKKRTQSKPSAEDSQTRQLQRELQRMRKKMDGLQQQIQCVTANPKPAQKKRQQPAVRQMNRDEKRRLSEKINSLPGKYLGEVVRIIQESISIRDDDAPPPEEIEIDMDALGNSTLRKLESFVDECLSKKKNPIVPVSQPVEGAQQEQNGAVDDPMGVQSDEESDTDSDSYTGFFSFFFSFLWSIVLIFLFFLLAFRIRRRRRRFPASCPEWLTSLFLNPLSHPSPPFPRHPRCHPHPCFLPCCPCHHPYCPLSHCLPWCSPRIECFLGSSHLERTKDTTTFEVIVVWVYYSYEEVLWVSFFPRVAQFFEVTWV